MRLLKEDIRGRMRRYASMDVTERIRPMKMRLR